MAVMLKAAKQEPVSVFAVVFAVIHVTLWSEGICIPSWPIQMKIRWHEERHCIRQKIRQPLGRIERSEKRPNYAEAQAKMQQVCSQCHTAFR